MHLLHELIFVAPALAWFALPCLNFGSGPSSSSSSTTTSTNTSSGQSAPNASGGSQSLGSGDIGVAGTGAKYLEQGATDLSGAGTISHANLTAGSGATIQIGDPQAVDALSQVAQQLAAQSASQAPTYSAGGGGGAVGATGGFIAPLTQNINWSLLAIIVGAALVVWKLLGGKK